MIGGDYGRRSLELRWQQRRKVWLEEKEEALEIPVCVSLFLKPKNVNGVECNFLKQFKGELGDGMQLRFKIRRLPLFGRAKPRLVIILTRVDRSSIAACATPSTRQRQPHQNNICPL